MRALHSHVSVALLATLLMWGSTPAESPVADAAMQGDVDEVRLLLRSGADVNAAQGDGMTALHWAAQRSDVELARMLIHAGANVQAVTRLGDYTPLHIAARAASPEVAGALLDAGADPVVRTTTGGVTPLHFAAASGAVGVIDALLDAGAPVDLAERARGQTPLMFAAAAGRTGAAQRLLRAGADPMATGVVVDVPKVAAADQAAGRVRDQVLETFRGDQPEGTSWQPSPAEVQAAVEAARAARSSERPADPEEESDENLDPDLGEIPLTSGKQGEYSNSYADLVFRQGGLSPLHYAVREGHAETAFALLEGGADIDQRTDGDLTSPILMAVINGHFDLALDLLERGADPDLESHAGLTPLYAALNTHWAPKARYPQQQAYRQQDATYMEVMESLLEAGADANVRLSKHLWFMEYTFEQLDVDTRGATPFWRAAYALDVPAMELLAAHGADPSVPTRKAPPRRYNPFESKGSATEDPSGLPPVPVGGPDVYPIHAATGHAYGTGFAGVSHRHAPDAWLPAVKYLVEEHGADVNARDANGFAPLHWAASRGDNEVIRYLVEHGADATVVSRKGHTTADMANGPVQRITPFPETIALLESLGSENNDNCVSC